MTTEKFDHTEFVCNVRRSPDTSRNWTPEVARAAGLVMAGKSKKGGSKKSPAAAFPPSTDWRASWWPVSSQGSTGACVGFAVGDGLARFHFVQSGKILSTQKIAVRPIWMGSKEEDDFTYRPTSFVDKSGTYLQPALDIVRKYGCVTEDWYGSFSKLYTANDYPTFYARAASLRFGSTYMLPLSLNAWRDWIFNQGPIMVRLDVDAAFQRATYTYGKLAKYGGPGGGGHAVCLVGYDPDGFIIRNSWGSMWGVKGFAHASNEYAAAAFDEAYGVVV